MIPRTRPNFTAADVLNATRAGPATVTRFQEALSAQLGSRAVLMPSGRGALYFLLRACARPHVVMPAYTCNAVTESALLAGCRITYLDSDSNGFNMQVEDLPEILDENCVLIATHQYGVPCRIHEMIEAAKSRGAMVFEDVAAALTSSVDGQRVGTFGDAAFYSFDPSKLLHVPPKAGALTAKDDGLLREVERLARQTLRRHRAYGVSGVGAAVALDTVTRAAVYGGFHRAHFAWRDRVTAEQPLPARLQPTAAFQARVEPWQAMLGLQQLASLNGLVENRREAYAHYWDALQGVTAFTLPQAPGDWTPIRFPILVHGDKHAFYRAGTAQGLDFGFSFSTIEAPASFTRAHELARSVLNVPFSFRLTSREVQSTIDTLLRLNDQFSQELKCS